MQNQQRLIDSLIKHWRRRKGAQAMPVYETFAPEMLGDEVWQQCCAFSVQIANKRVLLINDFVGSLAQRAIGRDITGEVLAVGAAQFEATRLMEDAQEVISKRELSTDEGHFVNAESKIIKFRSCLLPFGREERVTHLILGMSWRLF